MATRLVVRLEQRKRAAVRTKAKLNRVTTAHMPMPEQTPERVIGCFLDRHVKKAT